MKKLILTVLLLSVPAEASMPPTSYPLFLRQGFSCVLEFEKAPKRVVIGDIQSFQVEKMETSLVVRALTAYASSNMFVYFETGEPRLFILSASEDAEPTLYRKFESPKVPEVKNEKPKVVTVTKGEGLRVVSAKFDSKKDFLTVDVNVSAGSSGPIKPKWELVRLKSGDTAIAPLKTWAERKEIQKDASLRARFIFARPNVGRDLKDVRLVLPIQGRSAPFSLLMGDK
jgi:hypothetical protein